MRKHNVKVIAGETYIFYGDFAKKKDALKEAKHMRGQGWHVRVVKCNRTGFWNIWERK